MRPSPNSLKAAIFGFGLALAACGQSVAPSDSAADKVQLGLFSTLPIYWGSGGDVATLLDTAQEKDWVREQLERSFALTPLDALEPENLANVDRLLLAQPRPLAPSENVALDEWLRDGGRLLIFADPLLTRHSEFSIGDRRRPQDVVLISPILKRWGWSCNSTRRNLSANAGSIPMTGIFRSISPASSCKWLRARRP